MQSMLIELFWECLLMVSDSSLWSQQMLKKTTWNAIQKHMNGTQLLWRNPIKTLEGCTKLMLLAQTILKYKALTVSVRECFSMSSRMQESAACCDHMPSAFVPHGIHLQLSFWPALCRRVLLYCIKNSLISLLCGSSSGYLSPLLLSSLFCAYRYFTRVTQLLM